MESTIETKIFQYIFTSIICIWLASFVCGLAIMGSDVAIGGYLVAASIVMPLVYILVQLLYRHRIFYYRKKNIQHVVYYNIPAPPIVIKELDNTYRVGIPIESYPREHIHIPVYIATL